MDFSLIVLIWRNKLALSLIRLSIRLTSWGEVYDHLKEAEDRQVRYNNFLKHPE
jgi:hypothetical protein